MFSEKINNQIKFFEENYCIHTFLSMYEEKEFHYNLNKITEITDKFFIIFPHEAFGQTQDIEYLNKIQNYYNDKEIYLCCTTSTKIEGGFDPIVNILSWRDTKIRETILWESVDVKLFEPSLFNHVDKEIKGIFSVRKKNESRNYVFSKINKSDFDGIIRYANIPPHHNRTLSTDYLKFFPNYQELIEEYKKSYVAFVMETEFMDFLNNLTEKTLIPFLTKTIPIIYNGKNYVKELEEMGFFVGNKTFGYDDEIDSLETFSTKKMDGFINCIDNFNKMDIKTIQKIYNQNIEKIEKNYQICSELLFNKPSYKLFNPSENKDLSQFQIKKDLLPRKVI